MSNKNIDKDKKKDKQNKARKIVNKKIYLLQNTAVWGRCDGTQCYGNSTPGCNFMFARKEKCKS